MLQSQIECDAADGVAIDDEWLSRSGGGSRILSYKVTSCTVDISGTFGHHPQPKSPIIILYVWIRVKTLN